MFICGQNSNVTKMFNFPIGTLIPRFPSKYLLCNRCVVEKEGGAMQNNHSELF